MEQDIVAEKDVDERVRDYFSEMSDEQYEYLNGSAVEQKLVNVVEELLQKPAPKTAGIKRKAPAEDALDDASDGASEGSDTMMDDDLQMESRTDRESVEEPTAESQEQRFEKMLAAFEKIDLRPYQEEMVAVALKQNTIVHLGKRAQPNHHDLNANPQPQEQAKP